ncbi:hypothetical protein LSAT2_025863 [Lamellibrachia satsuma]|nr:hypothetical protein LSAT2_025863 [Lamellibrachia satsuma]
MPSTQNKAVSIIIPRLFIACDLCAAGMAYYSRRIPGVGLLGHRQKKHRRSLIWRRHRRSGRHASDFPRELAQWRRHRAGRVGARRGSSTRSLWPGALF